jgi:ribosomal protein L7/L12
MAAELTPQQTKQIEDALASGSKIEAIKLHREFTGLGLKNSKDFIDQLATELAQSDPAKYGKLMQKAKGCATVIVIGLFVSIGTAVILLK